MDPTRLAYEKFRKAKKFDPKQSSVLTVLNDQINGVFAVDTIAVKEARIEAEFASGRRI